MKSLVVLALLAAVGVGAAFFLIGRSAGKTTRTLLAFTDQAAAATASANVSAALASIEAFGAANGGYATATLWLMDGFGAASGEGWEAPGHWRRVDGEWKIMTLGGLAIARGRARLAAVLPSIAA